MHIFDDRLPVDVCNKMVEISELYYQKYVLDYKNNRDVKILIKNRSEISINANEEWVNFYEKDNREIRIQNVWPIKTFREVEIDILNTKNSISLGPLYVHYEIDEISNLISIDFLRRFNLDKDKTRIVLRKNFPKRIWAPHRDYFISTFSKPIKNMVRLWVSLTEPKFGHVLVVENKVLYWVEQGTVVTWDPKELHTGANLGIENRYFLTIVGESIQK